jgi:hypothetical protein
LDTLHTHAGKRKAAGIGVKREKGGPASKRPKKSGEGGSSSRDAVKRQSSANCTLNRYCALLDGAPPYSCLAEPCGVCVCVFSCIFCIFCILLFSCIFVFCECVCVH